MSEETLCPYCMGATHPGDCVESSSKIIAVTQSYDGLGNIDTEFYDLAQLTPDHPYRVAVEKALNNHRRVAVLDNYGQCFEPDTPLCEELMKATVELPATVVGQAHLRLKD